MFNRDIPKSLETDQTFLGPNFSYPETPLMILN